MSVAGKSIIEGTNPFWKTGDHALSFTQNKIGVRYNISAILNLFTANFVKNPLLFVPDSTCWSGSINPDKGALKCHPLLSVVFRVRFIQC